MDLSGLETIARFLFPVSLEFTQCSPIKHQLRCAPSSVYKLSSKAQNPKLFNMVTHVFWFTTLSVEHYSGKQPGSDP